MCRNVGRHAYIQVYRFVYGHVYIAVVDIVVACSVYRHVYVVVADIGVACSVYRHVYICGRYGCGL